MRNLTLKQSRYIAAYLHHGNKREAVLDAGYHALTRRGTDGFVYALNHNLGVQREIRRQLRMEELTTKSIVYEWAKTLKGGWKNGGKYSDYMTALKSVSKMMGLL